MNRKIIFGTLLSAFILLLLPLVPAVESNKILEANESSIINEIKQMGKEVKDLQLQIKNIDREELNERFKNIDQRELKEKINGIYKDLKDTFEDPPAEPQFIIILTIIKTILRVIYLMISLGYTILSLILSLLYFIITFIISMPITIILALLGTLINIIDKIIETIRDIIFPGSQITLT